MSSDKNGFFITSGNITYKNGNIINPPISQPNFIEYKTEAGIILLLDENGEVKGSTGRGLSPQEMAEFKQVLEKLQEELKR